ncbi:protein YhfH [Ammoniphilus sp. YIM 78166]|nr:protein YhfH [Ammoniphilus sp. YIM 78166]
MIMNLDFYKRIPQKECRECGEHFEEQAESYIYECERCFGLKEE